MCECGVKITKAFPSFGFWASANVGDKWRGNTKGITIHVIPAVSLEPFLNGHAFRVGFPCWFQNRERRLGFHLFIVVLFYFVLLWSFCCCYCCLFVSLFNVSISLLLKNWNSKPRNKNKIHRNVFWTPCAAFVPRLYVLTHETMKHGREKTSQLRANKPVTTTKQVSKVHSKLQKGWVITDAVLVKPVPIKRDCIFFLYFLPNGRQIPSVNQNAQSIYQIKTSCLATYGSPGKFSRQTCLL